MTPLLPEHMALVTYAEAAERLNVPASRVAGWVKHYRIKRWGWRGSDPIVAWSDVLDAEHKARTNRGGRPRTVETVPEVVLGSAPAGPVTIEGP